jgi:hypothetical protein
MYNVILRRVHETTVAVEKQLILTYFCVCACVQMYAHMCGWTDAGMCLCACSLTNPAYNVPLYCYLRPLAPPHFLTLCYKRHNFQKKFIENKMCILILSTILFETFLILSQIQRDIAVNVETSSCKVPVILVGF